MIREKSESLPNHNVRFWLSCAVALLVVLKCGVQAQGETVESLSNDDLPLSKTYPRAAFALHGVERAALLRFPTNYSANSTCGLVLLLPGLDAFKTTPSGWDKVLDRGHLAMVSPQGATNFVNGRGSAETDPARRLGMAIAWTLEMTRRCKVDPGRIYAIGLSGGARVASHLGFYYPNLYRGTIQCCGSDFPAQVPVVYSKPLERDNGAVYGLMHATQDEIRGARGKVSFTIVSGVLDFRYLNLLDIYNGGFLCDGYRARFVDVPGMGHQLCPPSVLAELLAGLDAGGWPAAKPEDLKVPAATPPGTGP